MKWRRSQYAPRKWSNDLIRLSEYLTSLWPGSEWWGLQMNSLLLSGHSIAGIVKSRSPTLQLHIEVSNGLHILFASINSQGRHIHRTYNESVVCLTSIISFAMHLVILSYVYDENMVQFNLIDSSVFKSKKQIRNRKHLMTVTIHH